MCRQSFITLSKRPVFTPLAIGKYCFTKIGLKIPSSSLKTYLIYPQITRFTWALFHCFTFKLSYHSISSAFSSRVNGDGKFWSLNHTAQLWQPVGFTTYNSDPINELSYLFRVLLFFSLIQNSGENHGQGLKNYSILR